MLFEKLQDIVGGSDEDEEGKEHQRNGQTSSLSLNLLSTLDSKNLATSMLLDRTGL